MAIASEKNTENDVSPFADIKALIDFLKVVFALFEKETLNKKGARHLFSLYVVLSELLNDFDKYVLYIKENFIELDSEHNSIFWEVNKLADSVARKHYELYRLLEGLDYGLESFRMPFLQFIKENRGRVSRSMGYSQDQIHLIHEHRKSFPTNLKPQYLRDVYRVGLVSGKVFVGLVAIKDNPQFHSYLLAHKPVHEGFVDVLNKLETIVKAQFEKNALL